MTVPGGARIGDRYTRTAAATAGGTGTAPPTGRTAVPPAGTAIDRWAVHAPAVRPAARRAGTARRPVSGTPARGAGTGRGNRHVPAVTPRYATAGRACHPPHTGTDTRARSGIRAPAIRPTQLPPGGRSPTGKRRTPPHIDASRPDRVRSVRVGLTVQPRGRVLLGGCDAAVGGIGRPCWVTAPGPCRRRCWVAVG